MAELISIDTMQEIMDWSYEKAVDGIGFGSAYELAQDYMNNDKPLVEQVNTLSKHKSRNVRRTCQYGWAYYLARSIAG